MIDIYNYNIFIYIIYNYLFKAMRHRGQDGDLFSPYKTMCIFVFDQLRVTGNACRTGQTAAGGWDNY